MPAAKKATKKAATVELPSATTREYGSTVFSVRVDREKAAELIGNHGFLLISDMGEKVALVADEVAYQSYKASP